MRLYHPGKIGIIVKYQRNLCLMQCYVRRIGQFDRDLLCFNHALCICAIGPQQARVHLLLGKRGLAPAKVTNSFGPVRKRLP